MKAVKLPFPPTNMSSSGTEDDLQYTPVWIENDHETSLEWKTIFDGSNNLSLGLDNGHEDANACSGTLSLPSDVFYTRQPSENSDLSPPPQRFPCLECSGTFSARGSLLRHVITVHHRVREYQCPECLLAFSRRDTLKRHRNATHQRIEPVECMRCGQLVKDRSLGDHLRSDRCRRHGNDPNREAQAAPIVSDDRETMLAEIFQRTEEDVVLFESLSTHRICDPLSVSSYLSYTTAQGLKDRYVSSTLQLNEQEPQLELFHLRGLTIRSIVRSLATGQLNDELDGAIRAFALTERILVPDAPKIHDAFIQYLDADRHHRQPQVLSALRSALDQWTPVSKIMDNMQTSRGSEASKAVVRSPNTQIHHRLESRKPVSDRLSLLQIAPEPSYPDLSSAKHFATKDDAAENQKQLASLTKRKRQSDEPASCRPRKTKTCPECGKSVVQRVLKRHIREVHGQEKVYECEVDECEEVFSRKASLQRHEDEQHGEGSNKIECGNCGESVCRRAMEDHVRRPKCQKKGHLDIQAVTQDAG